MLFRDILFQIFKLHTNSNKNKNKCKAKRIKSIRFEICEKFNWVYVFECELQIYLNFEECQLLQGEK